MSTKDVDDAVTDARSLCMDRGMWAATVAEWNIRCGEQAGIEPEPEDIDELREQLDLHELILVDHIRDALSHIAAIRLRRGIRPSKRSVLWADEVERWAAAALRGRVGSD